VAPARRPPTDHERVTEGAWHGEQERGSALGLRLIDGTAMVLGRGPARLILRFVMSYFFLFGASARRASRAWLGLHLDRVRRRDVWRHLWTFGACALDRFFLVRGKTRGFDLRWEGRELIEAHKAAGEGGILLGSHLGSFEAMSALSRDHDLPIHPAMYTEHARRITAMLQRAAPEAAARIIAIDPDDPGFALKLGRVVREGGFVALLGDRAAGGRTVEVDFFGRPAKIAAGPYLVAAALKCPVYLCTALYEEPNRYRLLVEPFADRVDLPRKDREGALRGYAQRYARRLEALARAYPFCWFNFYDFWS